MMPVRERPTSPHLQIYRWQIGNTLSILHRLTGIALAFGLLALCYWLMSLAGGVAPYVMAMRAFASPLGLAALIGWTFAFLYHLLNGVRHLFWDAGMGFERTERHASGWFAVLAALGLTLCVWLFIWRSAS
jgi:succinate dehydrogenase / fumarate reductase cytochrome b subunit